MKRLTKLLVLVALGAATQSCQDEAYSEVEQTVLEYDMKSTTDITEMETNVPGKD